jgi:hypothetical protein
MTEKSIESVFEKNTARLLLIPGVTGIAIGETGGNPCIKVFVNKKSRELRRQVPTSLEGYPLVVEEKGHFRALEP